MVVVKEKSVIKKVVGFKFPGEGTSSRGVRDGEAFSLEEEVEGAQEEILGRDRANKRPRVEESAAPEPFFLDKGMGVDIACIT